MITRTTSRSPDSYLELIRRFPLKAIRTEAEYDAAIKMLLSLTGRDGPADKGQRDYLAALSVLVGEYERERYPLKAKTLGPVALLKFIMSESGLSVNEIGKIIGSQSAASMILNGTRAISKEVAKKLAGHFKLEVGAFIA